MKKRFMAWTLVFSLVLMSSFGLSNASAYTATDILNLKGTPAYIHGANLPWLDGAFDHDIGYNPLHPNWGCAYNSTHMRDYLTDLKSMNCNVVRIWLFERLEGLILDSSDNVTGLDSTFLTNLDDIVDIANDLDISLYFTFMCGLRSADPNNASRFFGFYTDSVQRSSLINNAIVRIVTRYTNNNHIFAYDIMNECESDVAGSDDGNGTTIGITWDQMRTFISTVATAIHGVSSSIQVTCSTGGHNWLTLLHGRLYGLGLDFYDFHSYENSGYLPRCYDLGADKPVILGEYGKTLDGVINDTLQNTACANFLANARNKGYAGTLIWEYGYPGTNGQNTLVDSNGTWKPVCTTLRDFDLGGIPGPCTVKYNFETSGDGWTASNYTGGPYRSNEWSANGSYCFKADIALSPSSAYYFKRQAAADISGKVVMKAVVRRATWGTYGSPMQAKLYIQVGSSWKYYDSGSYNIDSSTAGTVLTLNLYGIANLNDVKCIGIQFNAPSSCSGASALYLDYVTLY